MVSIEKSDAAGGIQRAADRSDAAFSPAGRNHGRLDARHRSGIPTSLRLDLRINQRLARTLRRYREDQSSGAYAMIHMPRAAALTGVSLLTMAGFGCGSVATEPSATPVRLFLTAAWQRQMLVVGLKASVRARLQLLLKAGSIPDHR